MSTLLVIAPHADDETLGMGATIAKRAKAGDSVHVAVLTGHGEQPHPLFPQSLFDQIRAEAKRATALLGVTQLHYRELPAAGVEELPTSHVNNIVDDLIREVDAEELYLPYFHDMHRDHRELSYAGLVATRPYLAGNRVHSVSMYETPTETHLFPGSIKPAFLPNKYVDVSATIDVKIKAWECYQSQHKDGPSPRSNEALRALATWRGAHIGVAAAEAFMLIQAIER